jgi:hypothetical protein
VERELKIIFLSLSAKYPKFKDGIFMKRFSFCVLALIALVGFVGTTAATAATDTLTVIFDAPPEFDSTKGSVSIPAASMPMAVRESEVANLTAGAPQITVDSADLASDKAVDLAPETSASVPQAGCPLGDQNANAVPEASTFVLLGLGILGILGIVRKKK